MAEGTLYLIIALSKEQNLATECAITVVKNWIIKKYQEHTELFFDNEIQSSTKHFVVSNNDSISTDFSSLDEFNVCLSEPDNTIATASKDCSGVYGDDSIEDPLCSSGNDSNILTTQDQDIYVFVGVLSSPVCETFMVLLVHLLI